MNISKYWKQMCLILIAVSIFLFHGFSPGIAYAANGQTTIIVLDQAKNSYQVGEKVQATIRVSAPDGSYLTKAYCGFGYNASTMKKLTETDTQDHIWLESDTPVKWLSGTIEFEMRTDGKMYFIAGAYDGDGVIEAYKADGSKIRCPRASVVYKIGTGIYTATSDCNLESCEILDPKQNAVSLNREFDKNITEYWAEVPASCDILSIQAIAENAEDTVIIPEDLSLSSGENDITVGVQAVSGEVKDYIFHITRPAEVVEITDMHLYDVSGIEIDFDFKVDTYSYDINVPEDCDSISFVADTGDRTTVEYPTDLTLTPGYSSKYVTVRSASEEKVYEFYICRQLSSLSLSSLVVETSDEATYPLDPAFDPEIMEYNLNVPSDVTTASVIYTVANETDLVKEDLNEISLVHGDNDITLTVTDGVNEKVYMIHLKRDEKIIFTKPTEKADDFLHLNTTEHVGFRYIDLFFVAVIGSILIVVVIGCVILMLAHSKKDYDMSREAISDRNEKERKKRLKAIADAEKKAKKEKKGKGKNK